MKKTLFALLLFPLAMSGQNKIGFAYDASGNRVQRTILLQTAKPARNTQNSFMDNFGKRSVEFNYDSFQKLITVRIVNWKSSDQCEASIFSVNGGLVSENKDVKSSASFNLVNCLNGVYILNVVLNGETTTWKIVKK